jgi:hypothetical protein
VHPRPNFGQEFKGYFNAPVTSRYRFHMSCDDKCKFYMDLNAYDPAAPVEPTLTELAWKNGGGAWRDYFARVPDSWSSHSSSWIPLEGGKSYYIETEHIQFSGSEHVSVAVEIEQADTQAHPQSSYAVQHFTISQDMSYEEWSVSITGSSGGTYKINLLNPIDSTYW